ncbi:WD40-repeat-containing domain protein [Phlyctochytrium arcticum]|nr:WD40-repeat-containing domain protein [Phlyctochytrium arcticum]
MDPHNQNLGHVSSGSCRLQENSNGPSAPTPSSTMLPNNTTFPPRPSTPRRPTTPASNLPTPSMTSPAASTSYPAAPSTPRRRTKRRIEDILSPRSSNYNRILLSTPRKNASAHLLRSPMRNRQLGLQSPDDEDGAEDTYSLLMHREILDSPSKRGRIFGSGPQTRYLPPPPDCAISPKYLKSSLSAASQSLVHSPQRGRWEIPRSPFKILDAPELQDDYYLNLIDWSSTDILGVGLNTCVYLWSAASSKVTKLCDLGSDDSVTSVSWMQKGTHLAVGTDSGLVQLWDIEREKKVRQFKGHTKRVGAMAWNGELLTSGSRDKTIMQRDARMKAGHVSILHAHSAEVCGLRWSPDEGQLASGGNDNQLVIWDKRSDTPVWAPVNPHQAAVKAITWSPHRRHILASGGGTADRKIKIWNVLSGHTIKQIDTNSQVCNLAWGKQSEHLISTHGYSRNHITIWKQTETSLKEAAVLTGHGSRVVYLAMSPDGQSIVTGAGDETLRFWKICNAKKTRQPQVDTSTCVI